MASKNVLMIDRNFMVDPRNVLQAKALRNMGCSVLEICTESPDPEYDIIETGGLSIMRFSEREIRTIPGTRQTLDEWIERLRRRDLIFAPAGKRPLWRKIYNKFARLYFLSSDIRNAAEQICASPRHPVLRTAALLVVSCLSLVRGLAYLPRILFTHPFKTGNNTSDFAVSDDGYMENYFAENPLDIWERQTVQFALTISDLDAVHINDLPALRAGIYIAKKLNVPAVFDAHELYSYQPGIIGRRRAALFGIEAQFIHHCAGVVVINREQAEIMRRDYAYDNFVVLTNATERPEGFDVRKRYDYIRARVSIPPEHKIMIFMGGLSLPRKADQLLIGLAQARKDIHMVFLTWGVELPFFRELVRKLGIQDRVHFIDPVPCDEILFWCASADVGVMPYQPVSYNTKISSPSKLYEFITAATPIIGSSELINVRKIVEAEGFGVLKPFRQPEDYAAAIEEMFDESLGGPARFRAALIEKGDRYLWEQESGAFLAMYEQVLDIESPDILRKTGT